VAKALRFASTERRANAHPPLDPVSAAAQILVSGSHPKPGAQSFVPSHVVAHSPFFPQR
jgi:hypothetical protein